MKKFALVLTLLATLTGTSALAQTEDPTLQIAVETDVLAYTSLGGFSIWGTVQHHKNRLSISYVNYPNRYRGIYNDTGIKDDDQWLRLSLWRYWNDTHRLFYGINGEYHWRTLTEDENTEELSEDDIQIGAIVGYHWHPFRKKDNALNNLSFSVWAGVNYRLLSMREARVFEQTGSIYEMPSLFEPAGGINIIYTLFKK